MMHPLTGPENYASTPPNEASGAPPVGIHSALAEISSKSNKASLIPFLLSKRASEVAKYENKRSENGHHLMRFASNDDVVEETLRLKVGFRNILKLRFR